jgi:hypothetical protein
MGMSYLSIAMFLAASPGWAQQFEELRTVSFETMRSDAQNNPTIIVATQRPPIAADTLDQTNMSSILGTKATVIGTVTKVKMTRLQDAIIIDFHEQWQSHLSIIIPPSLFSQFPDYQALLGKRIQVTGIVAEFKGQIGHNAVHKPEILLSSREQLVVMK